MQKYITGRKIVLTSDWFDSNIAVHQCKVTEKF